MRVSVLPFVDLLIMVASVLLLLGFVGKVTAMVFGVSPSSSRWISCTRPVWCCYSP